MRVLILGSGTSTGVPVIGCDCGVCRSVDPKNKRTRSSILVTFPSGQNVLIDTSTDLRAQSLANNVRSIDAVLYTHAHADHLHGIDDLRSFNLIKKGEIPCYGNALTMERIKPSSLIYSAPTVMTAGSRSFPQISWKPLLRFSALA